MSPTVQTMTINVLARVVTFLGYLWGILLLLLVLDALLLLLLARKTTIRLTQLAELTYQRIPTSLRARI